MEESFNFDKIEEGGKSNKSRNLSDTYSVKIGGFGPSGELRTFLTTLSISQLKKDIEFYEKLSNDKDWPVSQIIQREVDKSRVNSITKKYLLGKGRLVKYFPPIIVALLPKDGSGNFAKHFEELAEQDSNCQEQIVDQSEYRENKEYRDRFLKTQNSSGVNGLYLFEVLKTLDHNIFCWDKDKFFAVVIDGQHRLAALLQAQDQKGDISNLIQDVAFIDVSPLIKKALKEKMTPVEVLRTIFIDINTNAKSVSLVRRILIDDKDLASLCVQSLVDSVYRDGTTKQIDSFIPSSLIDWHGESYKHELPHLTGILTLNQILSDELVTVKLISIDDHRDLTKIKGFIDLLNQYFFVDSSIDDNSDFEGYTKLTDSFTEYLKEKEINLEAFAEELQEAGLLDSFLFNYDYRTLEVAQSTFEKIYLRSIRSILTEFYPYKNLIHIIESKGGLDPEKIQYRALLSTREKIIREGGKLKDSYLELRKEVSENLSNSFHLFFLVVGQKALFKVFFERIFADFKKGVGEEYVIRIKEDFLKEINSLMTLMENNDTLFGKNDIDISTYIGSELKEYGSVATSFWEGILFEDKRVVYNSQGVRAFADVILICLDCLVHLKNDVKPSIQNYNLRYANVRTKRLLKKRFSRTEEEYNTISRNILNAKKKYISDLIRKIFESKKGS